MSSERLFLRAASELSLRPPILDYGWKLKPFIGTAATPPSWFFLTAGTPGNPWSSSVLN